ncbi:MAG: hypothetical protein IT366_06255 [Candidatus Hydrogenedentes bacterium]|nr:hypothetical protein [Candidatus Hydrogenedentota bacterium]
MSTDIELESPGVEEEVQEHTGSSDAELLSAASPVYPRWPLVLAGSVAALIAFCNSLHAFNGGIAFGPWQGVYLDLDSPYRAPLLSVWIARAFVAIPFLDRATCTVLASMVAGALACGALAVTAAQGLRERLSAPAVALCGATAGAVLALTPLWTRLCITGAPAPVTLLFALAGMCVLHHALHATAPRALVYAAMLFGLATVNDPSFAIVFVVGLLAALGDLGEREKVTRIVSNMVVGYGVIIPIPLLHAFFAGESLAEFSAHAMNTSFPVIGDGVPQFGFGLELRPQFAWEVLGVTILGMGALFRRHLRGAAVTWGIVFLAMGPFLPALTNQHSSPFELRDSGAAAAIAYAAVSISAAWGLAWIAQLISRLTARKAIATGVLLLILGSLVALQFRTGLQRSAVSAEATARGLFAGCPEGATLIVGDANITSLLRTFQIAKEERRDVTVIPVHALEQPELRERMYRKFAGKPLIPTDFPPMEAWKRWPLERPNEFNTLNLRLRLGGVQESDFIELMLWEIMRNNFNERPVCFAGISTPWLTARAENVGLLLQYPRNVRGRPDIDPIAEVQELSAHMDPECAQTMLALILPIAEASRRQNDVAQSERIANLARALDATDANAWLVSARAAARAGKGKEAEQFAANYIPLAESQHDRDLFLDLIKEDLRRNSIAAEFASASIALDSAPEARQRRAELATELWKLDEIAVLSDVYSADAEDFEDLFEGAAAEAQLGQLATARDTLGRAVEIDKVQAFARLQVDGRFFMLFDAGPENFNADLSS